nr:adenosine deaminase family protein [Fodinicola feengrottensis]
MSCTYTTSGRPRRERSPRSPPATKAPPRCRLTRAALADYFTFSDFAHFIEVYQSVVALIRTTEDLHLLTYEVARDLAAQQVRYVELQVTPYTHFLAGIATQDLCAVIEDVRAIAAREFGVQMRWIFDIPGEYGIPSADVTLAAALGQRPDGLLGFGLGGPEIGHPRGTFQSYFDQAIAAGLHSVPHAGESTGPQTIWDALTLLRAERIGHGTHCMEDPKLVEHLAERQIPLEVSPTSNVCTRVVESYAQHPLPRMVEAGLLVTINSDDPPMFAPRSLMSTRWPPTCFRSTRPASRPWPKTRCPRLSPMCQRKTS